MTASAPSLTVAYCHCGDCKRWTGSPLPAFAAFLRSAVEIDNQKAIKRVYGGVTRWNCSECGSPLMACFDYLPDQAYVPVGIASDAESLIPRIHCHADNQLSWLNLRDDLPQNAKSGREVLNKVKAR